MINLRVLCTSNNASFFTRNHKKALVRLQQVDKDTQEVKELGFGFKAREKLGNNLIVVTSSSTLPEGIQGDEIVVDRFRSKSKNRKYKTKPQDQVIVESIQEPEQDDIRYLSVKGGNEKEFFKVQMDNTNDISETRLSAFAFEDKKIVELQFENKQETWHFTWKSKEDFDVKKAKGAPVIMHQDTVGPVVIGVLSTNSSGQLYPLLFTKDFNVPKPPNDEPSDPEHSEYTRKLKSSIKRQTESLPALESQTAVSIDNVFTNVTIQRGEKSFKKDQEKRTYGREQFDVFQARSTTLKHRSDMFIWPEKDDPNCQRSTNPKCILITGVAGIGKSEYLKKVVWDWADDQLLQKDPKYPDFKFAFKLKFSQLGLLNHEELDLCDILNRSSLLDDQSIIDKGLLQYMIENPEKVLIIFDGYDEYGYRAEITGNLEEEYPNDPCQKMPVPAMIAKIMKGKIFKESVVMISSRPEEAQELKKFPFDVKCEIQGFSPLQVEEFIQKYFKDDESIRKKVLEHIKMNEILLSFGRIPVMCYLMCYYLKWHMTQSKTTGNLPNTRSELYYEVIKKCISRHSYTKMTETEVEEILYKLAELAIYLMREKKMIFSEEDMMKSFKFSEQELTKLKKSGLFDCWPGVKKSPFDKPPLKFVFSHLTMQEFLCALGFVGKKQLPEKEGTSEVIWTFMAGLLRRKNDEKLMDQLIEKIKPQDELIDNNRVLTLHCLYEYRDDELSKRVINKLHDKYCNSDGEIRFIEVKDLDCLAIRYFLYIVKLLTVKQTTKHLTSTQSFKVNALHISFSSLSPSGVSVLCESLSNSTLVTRLGLWLCGLDDECVKIIAQTLKNTTIIFLDLRLNSITDEGVKCVCDVVSKTDCHVKVLDLSRNDKITDECKIIAEILLRVSKPDVQLWI